LPRRSRHGESGQGNWTDLLASILSRAGLRTVAEAQGFMDGLGSRYEDTGKCPYCMKGAIDA